MVRKIVSMLAVLVAVVLGSASAVAAATIPSYPPTTATPTTATPTTAQGTGPTLSVTPNPLVPGGSFSMQVTGATPGASCTFQLESTPVVLGTAVADATGTVSLSGTVPADFPLGSHTARVIGDCLGGGSLSVGVTVAASVGANPTSGSLPVTGSESSTLVPVGLALAGIGLLLVVAARRRGVTA